MDLSTVFGSVLDTTSTVDVGSYLLCTLFSLVLGLVSALFYCYKTKYSRSFVVTIALLPAIVQLVIMLVNGNIGTGVAVMGAFSLVRFRSIPGTAKDIAAIFLSMAIGLATGIGFLGVAVVFVIVMGIVSVAYTYLPIPEEKQVEKQLRITIPETLDYEEIFDDLFDRYTSSRSLELVKTTNMGSLYQLRYHVTFKQGASEKRFLDEIRCRNGNLEVALGRQLFINEAAL
jgi:uncharacterized membrane protein YhiD involved in acid resistance